jgi:hypothetical protein
MLGIVITILAVLAVICFAFHYSDNTPRDGSGFEAFLSSAPKYLKENFGDTELKKPQDEATTVHRKL